jgi:hypothetical protein
VINPELADGDVPRPFPPGGQGGPLNGKLAVETHDSDHPFPDGSTGLMARLDDVGTGGDLRTRCDDFAIDRLVSRDT